MRSFLQVILMVLTLLALPIFAQHTITVDGDMLDWAGINPADTGQAAEELGDMLKGPNYDLQDIYITSDANMVYLRITFDPAGSLVNGFNNGLALSLYLDTDVADTSGLNWGWWTTALDYLIDLSPAADPNVFATELTILNNRPRMNFPVWPTSWDSVGVAQVALSSSENELEMGIPIEYLDVHTNLRPVVEVVGEWDWDNPDVVPNGLLGWDPAWMIDYYLAQYMPAVYAAEGADIETPIQIDGDMFDWAGINPLDVNEIAEETGDMPTGPDFDIQDVYLTSDTNNVYVRIAIDPAGSFSGQWNNYTNPPVFELWFDTYLGDTLGLGWGGFWIQRGDYKVNLQDAYDPANPAFEITLWQYAGDFNGAFENYDSIGVATAAVNSSDNEIEVAVSRERIVAGSDMRMFIYSVGDFQWDFEEYFPDDQTNEVGPSYAPNYNFITGATIFEIPTEITGIDDQRPVAELPREFTLSQNYPNPFNPSTTIEFYLPRTDHVELVITNVLGQKVRTLYAGRVTAGSHQFSWDGTNENGATVASGVYLYHLKTSLGQLVKKMLFIR
ncbi:MAG: T9SS type A sorting domain-containing protein [Aliifodinibius sp.]|nr:T9SS type A sorting domain-containing protein [Fodinibius sp.]NIW45622.1 T9SS type A sorting domain-containing protein [Gammaproteobacteria bacterium]NIX56823.1 T9SS type A sorting domain-containing protein [candidate division Zixibacteria bacterium]NIY26618.1 T9SS type A sorting domain-containing protein [Fodinibius sp.]